MPRSRLVEIQENVIQIPEEYHVYMPKDNLLVITKPFSTQYAIIDVYELKVLMNTIQRKSLIPTIITTLSWTPENVNVNARNGKNSRKSKNGSENKEPPRITMLNFIKPKKVVVVQQQPQTQPQTQQTQATQQQNQKQ
jgi:hypothetical protein